MTDAAPLPPGAVGRYEGENEAADRAAIHALLMGYGDMLDRRDWEGFAGLFGEEGTYVIGDREERGPQAAATMREVYRTGKNVARTPNFHMFFNEVITFTGRDRAWSTSMCIFMVTDDLFPVAGPAARYEDDLVKKDGRWYFARRKLVRVDLSPHEG